jgi:peptide/nickel transport system permease protein
MTQGLLQLPLAASRAARSRLCGFLTEFVESRGSAAALITVAAIVAIALFAPLISPTDPYDLASLSILDSLLPPGAHAMSGMTYWFGTDDQGRDLLSAIIYGLRTSLYVGVVSSLLAMVAGTAVGLLAGYRGGLADTLLMRIVDLQLSLPAILIALMLLAILGRGVDKIIIALFAVQWAYYARTARGSALVESQRDYIEAVRGLGLGTPRILFGHLLPNCLPPVIVVATLQLANAILLEATLSFLGLGLPPTEPSLGLLIGNGYDYVMSGRYWISLFPGLTLVAAILAINLVGDRLRDVLNPRFSH